MRSKRTLPRLGAATVATGLLLMVIGPVVPAHAAGGPNLAAGKTVTASSSTGVQVVGNVNDGSQDTYWESTNNALPQWVQVDLGSPAAIDQVVLKLPAGWGSRDETLTLLGSTDGSTFSTILGSAAQSFDPGAGNTVRLNFASTTTRFVRVSVTANTGWPAAQISELEVYGSTSASGNLVRSVSAGSSNAPYAANNAADGNTGTYWESANNAFPQWYQADLGSAVPVNKLVLRLPSGWEARSETLKVQGSTDGANFTDLVASAAYTFNPATGNSATINLSTTTTRYVRLSFTANSAWPAAQLSEFEVYGPSTGDTQAPGAPGSLAYTQPGSGQIRLTWTASTDNVGVTGYDVYANGELLTSVAGNVLTYTDSRPDSATVSYYVKAKDAAGNQSAASNTVTRTGQSGDTQAPSAPGGLAYTQPGSGQIRLTWTASTDNVGVTGYDVYANGSLKASVGSSVLTYTDSQPDTATVSYYVKAKDAAGNQSDSSTTVIRTGQSGGNGTNLAAGKPITANSSIYTFVATNANDNDVTSYWEGAGGSYPNTLTVALGSNADTQQVVLKLNPASVWGARTQTVEVLGREQNSSTFSTLVAAKPYAFDPASGNTVTIPVTARAADVQLKITSNTGSGAGQVAEFQVVGVPAPNPDLTVTGTTVSPASPVETDALTLATTVKNQGNAASAATSVTLYLGATKVGTAQVGALAPGASSTVNVSVPAQNAGSYQLTAKVDEANAVIEQDETNNTWTAANDLVVNQVASSDLVASPVSWSPSNPAAGNAVDFSVAIKNQGPSAAASGAHGITLTVLDSQGNAVKTLTGSYSGAIAPGATTSPVSLGSWTAVNGKYTVRTVIAADSNELPVKQANNTSSQGLYIGRGANMPFDTYEAEDGVLGGGAAVVGPNRTIGDLAGEASGRKAVTLNSTGSSVEFTTKAATNTLVTRFSIPDSASGDGTNATLNVYVDGTFLKAIDLTSKYAWLYGSETAPGNSPGSGSQRHIYDEANLLLGTTVPAGHKIKLQKDSANSSQYAIDFVSLEQATPIANPDPATYVVPAGFTHQDVQNALDKVRMDTTGTYVGVYLPAGDYQTANKFQVYGKVVKVVGAGPWFTRFYAPTTQSNTDVGFRAEATANGSTFSGFAYFGNYTSRIDGPGKVFDFSNVANITIDNIWTEHMVCMYWGANTDSMRITNSRIRDTFADGINMTNGSTDNLVSNNEARATGDDSFALFSAVDAGGADEKNNVFENLTTVLTWRAAGIAVYGGYANTFRNIYIADTLCYSAVTISSLDFGYPMNGFGASPTTNLQNMTIVRSGGHFWGQQVFPAIWVFSASKVFQGIRVSDVDIVAPTYSGIMFQTKYTGSQPENPVKDTVFTNISITGAKKSGDAFDAKSGYGIWANEMPEAGQGPAVGEAVFNNLTMSGNVKDIQNTTSTFKITVNP
ncbi:discoidin domain-containing protein [Kitasatospora sp. DSM 101779]|uniref:discoidin domain-containing protein n=1 Tax=Kitasatospora sp. DSM 101779 TaxID=2853165 RepID=UPI0021D85029|nr:discoidin domain-containing protein [Kitasatospora sp. DSM 101779]MCU7821647.1 discoidin domain-containing protein [Kitasatospora sp. DSM 101779]